jgi:amphi-Trp domain-containing protein
MPEEVLFKSESVRTRSEIADYLRTVADSLDAGGEVTFRAGDDSIAVDPPERSEFEVKIEREGPAGAPGELGVEFELEWDENGGDDGDLQVE